MRVILHRLRQQEVKQRSFYLPPNAQAFNVCASGRFTERHFIFWRYMQSSYTAAYLPPF